MSRLYTETIKAIGVPSVRDRFVAAFAVFIAAGIATGHLLGGPGRENRVVLALATATRHPGIAMAVAHFVAPTEKLVLGAVLWYLIVGLALSAAYLAWCRRRRRIGTVGIEAESR